MIDSEDTKKELLRLLRIYESIEVTQNNFLEALDQNYFPMLLTKVDMVNLVAVDEEFFYSTLIKNYAAYALDETERHIQVYNYAQKQVFKLMKLIDEELADSN